MIELPWPSSSLSGHNTGHWRRKSPIVAKPTMPSRVHNFTLGGVSGGML